MFVADPHLTAPPDEATLWRYMDFERFVQLLDSATLWFSRADKFADRFEVAVPAEDRDAARRAVIGWAEDPVRRDFVWRYLARSSNHTSAELDALPPDELASVILRFANRFAYVSSWHRNDTESAALWAQYSAGNAVAIRTTAAVLREVLDRGTGSTYQVRLGQIRYLDYATESWGVWHELSAAFHKRRSFAYEQETRALINWPMWDDTPNVDLAHEADRPGIAIPVELNRLVQSVVISPTATAWFPDLVSSIMGRYGITGIPVTSQLNEEPTW